MSLKKDSTNNTDDVKDSKDSDILHSIKVYDSLSSTNQRDYGNNQSEDFISDNNVYPLSKSFDEYSNTSFKYDSKAISETKSSVLIETRSKNLKSSFTFPSSNIKSNRRQSYSSYDRASYSSTLPPFKKQHSLDQKPICDLIPSTQFSLETTKHSPYERQNYKTFSKFSSKYETMNDETEKGRYLSKSDLSTSIKPQSSKQFDILNITETTTISTERYENGNPLPSVAKYFKRESMSENCDTAKSFNKANESLLKRKKINAEDRHETHGSSSNMKLWASGKLELSAWEYKVSGSARWKEKSEWERKESRESGRGTSKPL